MTIKTTARLPAGQYFIGDPCYVLSTGDHDGWIRFLMDNKLINEGPPHQGECDYEGHACFVGGTSYGDGTYLLSTSHELSVDSGLLSAVPMAANDEPNLRHLAQLGAIITFHKGFDCSVEDGVFWFGDHSVNTSDHPDEEDWDPAF